MPRLLLPLAFALALAGCENYDIEPTEPLQPPQGLAQPQTTFLDLGRRYLSLGDTEQAKRAFLRSLRTEGITAEALNGLGVAFERQGLLNEALRYFERARAVEPDSVLVHNNIGTALYGLGRYEEARQSFRTAYALSSGTSTVAEQNLALAERALIEAQAEDLPTAENPAALQREGLGEYKIQKALP